MDCIWETLSGVCNELSRSALNGVTGPQVVFSGLNIEISGLITMGKDDTVKIVYCYCTEKQIVG